MGKEEQNKDRQKKKKKDRQLLIESPQHMNYSEILCIWQYQAKLPSRQWLFLVRVAQRGARRSSPCPDLPWRQKLALSLPRCPGLCDHRAA